MPRIFISYRRADSRAIAGRIYDRLVQAFNAENVFKDVDRIPPGSTFADVLDAELSKCNVLLIIIGQNWVNIADKEGKRRLDNPEDFVRIEVERGLSREGLLVIPVLVDEAPVPNPLELPDSLDKLSSLQVVQVRHDPDFHRDMNRLIDFLKVLQHQEASVQSREQAAARRNMRRTLAGIGVIALVALVGFLALVASGVIKLGGAAPATFDPEGTALAQLTQTFGAEVAAVSTAGAQASVEAILTRFVTETEIAETQTAESYTDTPTTTYTPSNTPTPTTNATATAMAQMTEQRRSTQNAKATLDSEATNDALATQNAPTNTPASTDTPPPSNTPSDTPTLTPTHTPQPTATPLPTLTLTPNAPATQTALAIAVTNAVATQNALATSLASSVSIPPKAPVKIGFMGPLTGPAEIIGHEQLNWAKLAIEDFNVATGWNVQLVEGDTELDPEKAVNVAATLVGDVNIYGIVGPAGSQEVQAVQEIFKDAQLVHISGSATSPTLTTNGYNTFFRTVPTDAAQGPTVGRYLHNGLGVTRLFVIDDQTSYSTDLAEQASITFAELGGEVVGREAVAQDDQDFTALVSEIGLSSAEAVFFPGQIATQGALLAKQLQEAGINIILFGADGFYSVSDFIENAAGATENAFVSTFAPDIHNLESAADVVTRYTQEYGEFGMFGPPIYVATMVVLEAMQRAYEGGSLTRETVRAEVARTNMESTIMGVPMAFDNNGDIKNAAFFIAQVKGDHFEFVLVTSQVIP